MSGAVVFCAVVQSKACVPSRGEYNVYSTFQSHEPEFDYLKSLEIEEKINKIRWLHLTNRNHFLLSTNGKIDRHAIMCVFAHRSRGRGSGLNGSVKLVWLWLSVVCLCCLWLYIYGNGSCWHWSSLDVHVDVKSFEDYIDQFVFLPQFCENEDNTVSAVSFKDGARLMYGMLLVQPPLVDSIL